ncbi:MAG: cytidylate kinase-like family protein [Bacteroidaceae bacterium]|nr:cytidylate kinase-like family protein [Bacteroidaceae bacterium]MBR4782474.1 cytidylate kinase-like family protein [Bacteroidaceae bacterium]
MISICIGRQLGSGGSSIAQSIADQLGFRYCDSEVINEASVKSGLSRKVFEKSDEERSTFSSILTSIIPFVGNVDFYGNNVDEEKLFRFLSQTINDFAERDNCVFVGRCAEYILRKKPDMVSIFVSADIADRVERIAKLRNVTPEVAKKIITQNDRRRANFHDFYSSNQWGHAATYDLCINTSRLGQEASTEIIMNFIRQRFGL